jgi:hypothetical protein
MEEPFFQRVEMILKLGVGHAIALHCYYEWRCCEV